MNNDTTQTASPAGNNGTLQEDAAEAVQPEESQRGVQTEDDDECLPPDVCGNAAISGRCRDWLTSVAPVTVPPSRMLASPEQLSDNFLALLESIHDEDAFNLLELNHWWQFGSRHRMKKELLLLYAGLWHLALRRSFPQDCETIFDVWKQRELQSMSRSRRAAWEKRLAHYVDTMNRCGDRDFRALSRHMALRVYADKAKVKKISFGLALHLRRIYTFLFEHLV